MKCEWKNNKKNVYGCRKAHHNFIQFIEKTGFGYNRFIKVKTIKLIPLSNESILDFNYY